MATTHKFNEYGSLADQCHLCGLAFSYTVAHRGWPGAECIGKRDRQHEMQVHREWLAFWDGGGN